MIQPQKYPRTPYSAWSPGLPDNPLIADMSQFIATPIVVTEKIDGSNVLLHDGKAYTRSVTEAARQGWLAMVRKHHAWKSTGTIETSYYGEDIYGVHTIEYNPVPEDQTFMLFATRQSNQWESWETVIWNAEKMDIQTVPELWRGSIHTMPELQELTQSLMAGPSRLGPEKEGLVIRRAEAFSLQDLSTNVCKIVRANHVQHNEEHWSKNWTPCRLLPPKSV